MKSNEQLNFIIKINKILSNKTKRKYKNIEKILYEQKKFLKWDGVITNITSYSKIKNVNEIFLLIDINNEFLPNIIFQTIVKDSPYIERDIQNLKTSSLVKFSGTNFRIKCYDKNYLIIYFEPLEILEQ